MTATWPLPGSVCHHKVGVESFCLECKIEWEQDCIASAEKSLTKHKAKLAALEGMRALDQSQAAPDPDKAMHGEDE